jgi:hypothetical protein
VETDRNSVAAGMMFARFIAVRKNAETDDQAIIHGL